MKATEILNNVKELLNLSKEELKAEEVKEEVKEVVLAEEPKEEVVLEEEASPKKEAIAEEEGEAPVQAYVTSEELSAVKSELMAMIKALIEDKPMGDVKEVPEELSEEKEVELSKEEKEVELSEEVEEVVHSPENAIETKKSLLSNLNRPMSTQERVNRMLFN